MRNRYLIALDLDGTLLNDDKIITEKTKKMVLKAIESGHIVVIATGRPYRASRQYYQELGLDTPIVNFNGAFVHHPLDEEWGIYHTPLPLDTAKTIIQTCNAFDVQNVIVEVTDDVYLKHHDDFFIEAFGEGEPRFHTGDLEDKLTKDPTSVIIYPRDDSADELKDWLDRSHAEIIEQRSWGAPWNLIEIVKGGINKSVGLCRIAKRFEIPRENIVAFGDEDNDLEMLEFAGHGIAMENAIQELKEKADTVTKSNNDDGIAAYLETIL